MGNVQDLTLRGRRILSEAEAILCDDKAATSALLAQLQIEKPLFSVDSVTTAARLERITRGANLALTAQDATALGQNPSTQFVQAAIAAGIRVEPIPGASSILGALVASGIPSPRFRFLGKLPAKGAERKRALQNVAASRETMILLDGRTHLASLLKSLKATLGADHRAAVACNVSMADEKFVRGTLSEIVKQFEQHPFQGEFVVIVKGNTQER